ncbi:unnamed protein product, partial [Hymenolepis diminuta]
KITFGTLTEEQFRCFIFISRLQTKPQLPLRTHLLKLMEVNPNLSSQEIVKEGVKMANRIRDPVLIDSDAISMLPVYKMYESMPQAAQFVTHPNPSFE